MTETGSEHLDQLCWGEYGLPLFPPQWKHHLQGHLINVKTAGRSKDYEQVDLRDFCSPTAWAWVKGGPGRPKQILFSKQTPLERSVEVITTLISEDSTFLDIPIDSGRLACPEDVFLIPYLTTTWEDLTKHFGDLERIADILATNTILEVYQTTGSIRTALDLAITTPSWLVNQPNGFSKVIKPEMPRTAEQALSLAGLRHLRATGAEFKYCSPESDWAKALYQLAGIRWDKKYTLEEAGKTVGVSRERVRQIQNLFFLNHSVRRRWPSSPFLEEIGEVLDSASGLTPGELDSRLETLDPLLSIDKTINLLSLYGYATDIGLDFDGTYKKQEFLVAPEGVVLRDIYQAAWSISGGTGFSRKSDLVLELMKRYPGITREEFNTIIDTAFHDQNLPLGYVFATGAKDGIEGTVTGIFERMLSWNTPLHISEIREGLNRRFKFRQLPAAPPVTVIRALINFLPSFDISNDYVSTSTPLEKETETVLGWIGALLEESPNKTLHSATILESARAAEKNQSSASIYLQFGEIVKRVGQGCVSLIGEFPTPDQIAEARRQATLADIKERINSTEILGQKIYLEVTVGTKMRNSGVLSINSRLRRLIGSRRLNVESSKGTHGTAKISGSTLLYGFSSAMNALEIIPGDEIQVTIDLEANTLSMNL